MYLNREETERLKSMPALIVKDKNTIKGKGDFLTEKSCYIVPPVQDDNGK